MRYLYNSRGQHVASEHAGFLFLKNGELVGRFIEKNGVFSSLGGHYLGEIFCINRLVYDRMSKYRGVNFGVSHKRGSIGVHMSPKNFSTVILPPGLEDVNLYRRTEAS